MVPISRRIGGLCRGWGTTGKLVKPNSGHTGFQTGLETAGGAWGLSSAGKFMEGGGSFRLENLITCGHVPHIQGRKLAVLSISTMIFRTGEGILAIQIWVRLIFRA